MALVSGLMIVCSADWEGNVAKQRYISTEFWRDEYILDLEDPLEKLLLMYCLTNEATNVAGIYKIAMKKITFESGIPKEKVLEILDRLSTDKKIYYVDGWVIISNHPKH